VKIGDLVLDQRDYLGLGLIIGIAKRPTKGGRDIKVQWVEPIRIQEARLHNNYSWESHKWLEKV